MKKTSLEIVFQQRAGQTKLRPLDDNILRYGAALNKLSFDEKIEIEAVCDEFCEKLSKMGIVNSLALVGALGEYLAHDDRSVTP